MDSLTFLERAAKAKPRPFYVLHGDEHFLKRQVLAALRQVVLAGGDPEFGVSTHAGDKAAWAAVHDELETLPFLAPRRLVVVENADPFVTRERARLEKYVTALEEAASKSTGVLVLDVQAWPAHTRLAKLVGGDALLTCKAPPAARLPEWCREWSLARHGKDVSVPAARLLVDLVGGDMGLLDQELAKLAAYAGDRARVEEPDVDRLVGNSRSENTWRIFDLIGTGQTAEALTLLDRLFDQGEDPLRLLGAFSMQLRRLAQVSRLTAQGTSLNAALEDAGVPPFARRNAEQQLRHLGRRRLDRLYDWLLETDLGLKGGSQLPPRTLLERLVVRLARPAPAAAPRSR
jgi:DNA polymerase-3 subunit delta